MLFQREDTINLTIPVQSTTPQSRTSCCATYSPYQQASSKTNLSSVCTHSEDLPAGAHSPFAVHSAPLSFPPRLSMLHRLPTCLHHPPEDAKLTSVRTALHITTCPTLANKWGSSIPACFVESPKLQPSGLRYKHVDSPITNSTAASST
jgi:hypothetical protein